MAAFLDMAATIIAVVFVVMGARRGAIREIFRFVAMTGGFFLAFFYFRDLQGVMTWFSSNPLVTQAVSFIILFIAAFLAIAGVGLLLRKFIKMVTLGWLDSTLGGTIGFLKAALVVWAICLSVSSMPAHEAQEQFGGSVVYKAFKAFPRGMTLAGLEDMRDSVRGQKKSETEDENSGVGGVDDDDDIIKKIINTP